MNIIIYNTKTHAFFLLNNFTSVRAEQSIWNRPEGEWKIVGRTVGMDGRTAIAEFQSKEEAIDVLNFILRNANKPAVEFITIGESKCTTSTTPPAGQEIMSLKSNGADAESIEVYQRQDAKELVEKNRGLAVAIAEALDDTLWLEETERVYRRMFFGSDRDTAELCDGTKEEIRKIANEAKDSSCSYFTPLEARSLTIEKIINEKYAG